MPSSGHAKCLRCEVVTAGNPWDWVQMCQGVTEFVSWVGDLAGSLSASASPLAHASLRFGGADECVRPYITRWWDGFLRM
jgi:hypothetical protein